MKQVTAKAWLFWFSSCLVLAGNGVGGGGIAENNILYAFLNIESYLNVCLSTKACDLTNDEHNLLKSIHHSMPTELKVKDLIVFKSEKKDPGFFIIEGQVRVAKTGYSVGSPIYINVDLLYPTEVLTIPQPSQIPPPDRPYDIPQAVGLLVHELGHHQGETNHTFLDLLGGKVQKMMRTFAQEVDGGPGYRQIILTSLSYKNAQASDLVIRDRETLYSYGKEALAAMSCKDGSAPLYYDLWNLHWMRSTKGSTPNEEVWPARARIRLHCKSPSMFITQDRDLHMDFTFQVDKKIGLKIVEKKTQFRQIDCGATPQLCH